MNKKKNLFWFRRDLRLNDNRGLYEALIADKEVLPIFIFDQEILNKLPKDDARISYIHQELENINKQLNEIGSSLTVCIGRPNEVFSALSKKHEIDTVLCNHDYEPYAIQRDQEIKELLSSKNIGFKSYKDQVIFERNEITKKDGTPYKVYTPYSKKWLEAYEINGIQYFPSEDNLTKCIKKDSNQFPTLAEIGFKKSSIKVASYKVSSKLIDTYEETRNFPAKNSTSRLGTHLRFGTVSVRKMVEKAAKSNNITFLKELIWREFFMQILWHFPQTTKHSFKPKYDRILWKNNENDFEAWCKGKTGYPLVDAGMRELNQTGFMHNRVRMLVGSFLCKHLLIDWRWGEAYFAEKLHDYEQSSNVEN